MSDRRNWTQADLVDIRKALAITSTEKIARLYGTNAKTLRSALKRHGISIRFARRNDRPQKSLAGVRVQRSAQTPAAIYGAIALAALPDRGVCHWPIGDPAVEGFTFCGAAVKGFGAYCETHSARAYLPPAPLGNS